MLGIVVLAAGQGTRMRSEVPKVLHPLCGRPMVFYALDAVSGLSDLPPVLVVGHGAEEVRRTVGEAVTYVEQREQLGTGHAVLQARPALEGRADEVLILYADMPLLTGETLRRVVDARRSARAALSILTVVAEDPRGFGRVVRQADGSVARIVEEADATEAERAIRESATAGPEEALEMGVIDLIAADMDELLQGFDGRTVTLGDGMTVTFHTADAAIREIPLSPIERLLQVLINPNVAFILLTIGVQAILIELASPGGWVAGFIGVLCLALAAYAMGVLPFNWLGLVLLGAAIVLFILDIKAPTHGALTAAGTATFIAGALILFNAPLSPYGQISLPLVIAVGILTALFFAFVVAKALQAQKPRSVTGREGLVGRTGVAKSRLDPEGWVLAAGERWRAVSEEGTVEEGEEVEVVRVEGFRLHVRRRNQ